MTCVSRWCFGPDFVNQRISFGVHVIGHCFQSLGFVFRVMIYGFYGKSTIFSPPFGRKIFSNHPRRVANQSLRMIGLGKRRDHWRERSHRSRKETCAMVKSRYIGDGHPTFNRNPYNGYINPYYWVDDHPLLYGDNGSLDPGTHGMFSTFV